MANLSQLGRYFLPMAKMIKCLLLTIYDIPYFISFSQKFYKVTYYPHFPFEEMIVQEMIVQTQSSSLWRHRIRGGQQNLKLSRLIWLQSPGSHLSPTARSTKDPLCPQKSRERRSRGTTCSKWELLAHTWTLGLDSIRRPLSCWASNPKGFILPPQQLWHRKTRYTVHTEQSMASETGIPEQSTVTRTEAVVHGGPGGLLGGPGEHYCRGH